MNLKTRTHFKLLFKKFTVRLRQHYVYMPFVGNDYIYVMCMVLSHIVCNTIVCGLFKCLLSQFGPNHLPRWLNVQFFLLLFVFLCTSLQLTNVSIIMHFKKTKLDWVFWILRHNEYALIFSNTENMFSRHTHGRRRRRRSKNLNCHKVQSRQ